MIKINARLFIIIFVLCVTFCFSYIYGVSALIQEQLEDKTPEDQISLYISAVSKGNKTTALDLWKLSKKETYPSSEYYDNLVGRRNDITNELIDKKISRNFIIKEIEWWNTCCMPSITKNSRIAGYAKIKTELINSNGQKFEYIFEIEVPGGYDGGLTKHYARKWEIVDIRHV